MHEKMKWWANRFSLKEFISKNKSKIIAIVMFFTVIFSCVNLFATGVYLYNSSDVRYGNNTSTMTATNVQDAIDEMVYAITTGCFVGYTKVSNTDDLYICNKNPKETGGNFLYDSNDVRYDNIVSALSATNVQDAITELVEKIPYCKAHYSKQNETSSSYECKAEVNMYTITFNKQEGTGGTDSVDATYGEAMPLAIAPTRTGYTFDGYYKEENGSGTQYYNASMESVINWDIEEATTLYAKWTAKTYTITLNKNNATNTPTTSTTATYDATTLAAIATRPARTYTVSFDKNGTGATATTTALTSTYTFAGWYTAASGGSKVASNAATPALQASVSGYTDANSKWTKDGTATLYAQWTGGSVTLPAVTRTGYTCAWYTAASGGTKVGNDNGGGSYSPTSTITLYARCAANTYTITLDNQSATSAGTTAIYEKYNTGYYTNSGATTQMTTSANPITKPTKQCYTFAGYYTAASGGTQYIDANGYLTSSASTTNFSAAGKLYAHWTANSTVYVKSDGNDTSNIGTSGSPFATIAKAYACPGNLTIKLLSNITQNSQANFNTASKQVTLTSNSGTYTITRASGLTTGSMIRLTNGGTLTTTNVTFDGYNRAASKALLEAGGSSTLNLNSGTTVKRGNSSGAGGGIYVNSATLNITGATVTANKVTGENSFGGGITVVGGVFTLNSGTISDNTSSVNAGGIYGGSGSTVYIKGGTISGNSSSGIGGGVYSYCSTANSTLSITGGTITENESGTHGAGVCTYPGGSSACVIAFSMSAGTISSNSGNRGGGILLSNSNGGASTASISGGTISSNTAKGNGGGIYQEDVNLTISGSTKIQKNSSDTSGGGIYVYNATLTLNGGTIGGSGNANTCQGYGGGIRVANGSTLLFKSGRVTYNSCTGSTACGGGIWVNSGATYTKTGGTLSNNTPNNTN